jgi:hypothetical protein
MMSKLMKGFHAHVRASEVRGMLKVFQFLNRTSSYVEIGKLLGLFAGSGQLAKVLGKVMEIDVEENQPLLCSLVVGVSGSPGTGYFAQARTLGFNVPTTPAGERAFWEAQIKALGLESPGTTKTNMEDTKMENNMMETSDWFLRIIATMCEEGDRTSVGVTVTVRGTTFTGQLVSRKAFFEQMLGQLDKSGDKAKGFADGIRKGMAETNANAVSEDGRPLTELGKFLSEGYLHIIGSIVAPSGARMTSQDGFWRVRAADVDGFLLGTLTATEPK